VLCGPFLKPQTSTQLKKSGIYTMIKSSLIALSLVVAFAATPAMSKNIVQTAAGNKNFTTLVAAVKAAGLVGTLSGKGPFTVFAPTNAAFAKLPAGTVAGLLKPEAKGTLTKILTCHVVSGKILAANVIALVKKGGGKVNVKTVGGCNLKIQLGGGKIHITDESGGTAQVTAGDLIQSNGVIHVINKVLLPKL
jgi:uncharacterized surface protein with fasciclin (FAS1) repeats